MSEKRALVVDDSKSARAFLARVLERYDLGVDSVESAEQAIEFLKHQRPDVIFMDHLMPGMDGLQAVQAIKNNPQTATIPIMMYTSQEGELYLSQARALGAIGVLPKQVKHADVSKALEQLNLLGEPTPERDLGLMPTLPELEPPLRRATDRLPPMAPELRAAIETILRDHTYELRRFVVENLESTADRIIGDVRLMLKDEVVPPPPPPPQASVVGAWLTVLAVLLAAIFAAQWWREAAYNSALTAQLQSARAPAGALLAAPGTSNALNAPSAPESAAAPAPESQLIEPVPFGEMPLGGARIDRVQALFARLNAQNFRGTVQIRTYPGRFCLQGSGDTATLAPSDTPYAKCDGIGNPRDEGSSPSQRESVAFANMLAAWRKSIDGAFDIEVSAAGADEVAEPYPPLTDALTAGDWNHAAAANNRVEVRWQAAP